MAMRLYIGGLSTATNVHDLQVLLSKVCPIHYIYFPEPAVTHLHRGFAIAILQQSDDVKEKALKCVKLYNNCHWKGSKMRVELAKEYYIDKIKREVSSRDDDDLLAMKRKSRFDYEAIKPFIGNVICMKKSRYQEPFYASTVPQVAFTDVGDNSNIIYGKKTLFKYDDNNNLLVDVEHEHKESVKQVLENVVGKNGSASGVEVKVNAVGVPVADPIVTKEKGGGIRKGFGTLAASVVDNSNDCCVENVKQLHTFDNYEIDEAPCLNPEDVDDSALEKERLRQLQFLSQLLGASGDNNEATTTANSSSNSHSTTANSSSNSHSKNSSDDNTDADANLVGAGKSFTNTKVMKEIFYKEGGVWWGDDGTMKEAVEKGKLDPLFLEAEKYGIDIRSNDESNDQNVMKFSFFEDDSTNPELVTSSNDNNGKHHVAIVDTYVADTVDAVDVSIESIAEAEPMSLVDIIKNARLFVRDDTVENIIANWKNVRLKLAVDYKRKCRDARKKIGNKKIASQHTTGAAAPPTHKEIKDWKQKKRGGVKHRRKS